VLKIGKILLVSFLAATSPNANIVGHRIKRGRIQSYFGLTKKISFSIELCRRRRG